jgi:hypothetical protein
VFTCIKQIYLFLTLSDFFPVRLRGPPSFLSGGALPLGVKWPAVKLTSHLHIMPRSRMHGVILPVSQFAFMAWCSAKVKRRGSFTFTFKLTFTFTFYSLCYHVHAPHTHTHTRIYIYVQLYLSGIILSLNVHSSTLQASVLFCNG